MSKLAMLRSGLHFRKNREKYIKVGTLILSVVLFIFAYIYFTRSSYTSSKTFTIIDATVREFDLITEYSDGIIASSPELYDGLIPVTIDSDGAVKVADTSLSWYNYSNHNWANAVIVSNPSSYQTAGTTIDMNDILQMYVWIPRYRYKLWNAENGSSDEQMIEIEFESSTASKSSGSTNDTYLTHPAFTFGSTELEGFWVGKFETGYAGATSSSEAAVNSVDATKVIIKPSVYSWRYITVGNMFNTTRGVESESMYGLTASEVDTHMMKNMEWGAVAYLSHSKYGRYNSDGTCISSGCEVWTNPNNPFLTGYSGTIVSASKTTGAPWNDSIYGGNSSTTGNLYGVYDMSGGAFEYVMGNVASSSSYSWTAGSSGLSTAPDTKYYDAYVNNASSNTAHQNGKLGDATKETLKTFGSATGGWYSDYALFPSSSNVWFPRGGTWSEGSTAGAFNFTSGVGNANNYYSWRVVLSVQ